MKNLKTVLIVLFAIIILILIFFLVKNIKNNNNSSQNNKMISEIDFMDSKLTSLLNSINNITLENYKITVTRTNTDSNQSSNQSEQRNNEGNTESSGNEKGLNQNTSSNSRNTVLEKYSLETEGILTNKTDINWNEIKNEVETLYTIIPTITLDLYNMNINQEDILNFNEELDDLTIAVKNEDKENSLIKLANLYRYLPAYANSLSNDSNYISVLETKSNIFNAYVFVDLDNWDEASNYTNKAIESFSRALNNIHEKNTYDTNKTYIILNEIQNAVNIKDKDVFLIKYKNFIEETEKQGNE